ncbi:virulence factor TspB C-terminal domain-related protein [Cupriavidus sp. HMR-1]|uniref:virulence factor TspB C-terminal domain-related protein n=1 Tax=Cupriavidus sp. HMR-1 TaxID=1249621 RepID=UPI001267418E|nr:virulence factor TspB C-terminal domain-related protein [Cupriavidus sp. HMR-1]
MGWVLAAGDAGSSHFDGVKMTRGCGFDWLRLGITAGRVMLICLYGVLLAGLLALVVMLGSSMASAASIPLVTPSTVAASASSASGFVTTASATSWSGAAFNSALTTQVAGKAVTVPATWRLAANAGQIAVNALRINPAGLAASVAVSWLLGYGIQWASDHWQTTTPGQPASQWGGGYNYTCTGGGGPGPISVAMATACGNYAGWTGITDVQITLQTGTTWWASALTANQPGVRKTIAVFTKATGCPPGTTDSGTACVSAPTSQPSTDADWAKVDPATIPDAVLNNLAKDGVFLGVSPTVNTARQGITLGAPYIDPVTGRSMVDMAYVTPAADGKTADLQLARQQVDANGNPATDASGVAVAPVKQDDPCVGNPTRLGCMTSGDIPQGPDLQQSSKTISITPDSGWGPDSMACPADVVVPLHGGGGSAVFSYRPACDFADGARPVVIAFAWVAAVLIALGVGNRGGE